MQFSAKKQARLTSKTKLTHLYPTATLISFVTISEKLKIGFMMQTVCTGSGWKRSCDAPGR